MSVCRFCGASLNVTFADLGMSPLANSLVAAGDLDKSEPFFPLHARVCEDCLLVQLDEFKSPEEIFSDYSYFSSYSSTWLEHAARYAEYAIDRFELNPKSFVVEVASNDGYLLQYFAEQSIPVLGIEPAGNVAAVAREKGVPTICRFFGSRAARRLAQRRKADLLIGNNVLAHVPDINDFVAGVALLVSDEGHATFEFPHLLRLIDEEQFDTIYHEHFSYFSLSTVERIFAAQSLRVVDAEELATHGGSLRIFVSRQGDVSERVVELRAAEKRAGLHAMETYASFDSRVKRAKRELLSLLIAAKDSGKLIAAYGAPAKGNTLLNYCGIGRDFIDFTVDRNPHKQGHYLPGTHIPIRAPEELRRAKPDILFILPWNLRDEILDEMSFVREWGGRFLLRSPELHVYA
jgi:2-polyprenyl-3-methyl-5-hydroxy-6-metoxy-1,4-benzoquinol methylase